MRELTKISLKNVLILFSSLTKDDTDFQFLPQKIVYTFTCGINGPWLYTRCGGAAGAGVANNSVSSAPFPNSFNSALVLGRCKGAMRMNSLLVTPFKGATIVACFTIKI